jgi:hypothetical protein
MSPFAANANLVLFFLPKTNGLRLALFGLSVGA